MKWSHAGMTIRCLLLISVLWAGLAPTASADTFAEPASVPPPAACRPTVPDLGRPPELPAHPELRPTPSLQATSQATGLTVTTTSREQSRNFFNALYPASENIPAAWTGNLATCSAGTTADPFKDAVQLRINYFRAMAGVPAAISLSPLFSAKNQKAALMMSRNDALSHNPPTSWSCYTAEGNEAAGNSNLALGSYGWGAISMYVLDHGSSNSAAGHRRWLLYPQTQVMGTGDIPANSGHYPANALWVFDDNTWDPRPATREEFVAWPPPGYVPYQVVYPRWSLSYPGADFSAATVTMTKDGVAVVVRLETPFNGYGENSLVWVPDNLDTNSTNSFSRPAADTIYTVTVGNVLVGGTPHSFAYSVTLFDPQTPGADHVSADVTGPSSPPVGTASPYSITEVPGADSYQWRYTTATPFTGSYDAENSLAGISATISTGYSPISTTIRASGTASYHLVQPVPVNQILSLERTFLPGSSGSLTFKSRLGWATPDQKAVVEVSTDDGLTWQQLYLQNGSGSAGETAFSLKTINLSPFADRFIRVRFVYSFSSGSYYNQTDPGVGWYLDDIAFTTTSEVTEITTSPTIPIPGFDFTPPVEGNYLLQARALLYGQYPLEWGPVLRVTGVLPPPQFSLTVSLTGNGTVTSDPTGISCPYGGCSKLFPAGKSVLLMATPDATNYIFGGWTGGGCSGTLNCSVPMTTATEVTARFDYVQPVRVPLATPSDYPTLTLAYGAVPDGGTILARAFTFNEPLILDQDKLVLLRGGYDTGFTVTTGTSVLNGRLTVSQGALVAEGLVIK